MNCNSMKFIFSKALKLRKNELKKSEYYLNTKHKIDEYSNKLSILEQNELNYSKAEYLKIKHHVEIKKERYKSSILEESNIESANIKIISRLSEVKIEKKSLKITARKMLGLDNDRKIYFVSIILIFSIL